MIEWGTGADQGSVGNSWAAVEGRKFGEMLS